MHATPERGGRTPPPDTPTPHVGPRTRWRRAGVAVGLAGLTFAGASPAAAQNDQARRPPVIDVHVHTFGGLPNGTPMCPFPPQFLASAHKGTEATMGGSKQDCVHPLQPSATPDEYMKATVAEWERLNVT